MTTPTGSTTGVLTPVLTDMWDVERGWTLPVGNTLPDVNPDEILASLDADTRDYLTLLVDGAGQGLKGRGDDLREVFRRFEPTHRDLAEHHFTVRLLVPLHVSEARLHVESIEHRLPHHVSVFQVRSIEIAQT